MRHELTGNERRLVQELAEAHRQAAAAMARTEACIRVAIAAMCAAHDLDGDWRISDDLTALVRVEPHMHNSAASAQVRLDVQQ